MHRSIHIWMWKGDVAIHLFLTYRAHFLPPHILHKHNETSDQWPFHLSILYLKLIYLTEMVTHHSHTANIRRFGTSRTLPQVWEPPFCALLRSDNRKRSTSDQCSTRSSNVLKRLMSNHSVLHGRRMFWNVWRSSKHNKTKDQVTFLITNPGLRAVTTLLDCHPHVGVITFYRNTLTKCWTFWNVRGLKVFLHSHMWGYFLKRRTFRNVWRLACANCVLDYFNLE